MPNWSSISNQRPRASAAHPHNEDERRPSAEIPHGLQHARGGIPYASSNDRQVSRIAHNHNPLPEDPAFLQSIEVPMAGKTEECISPTESSTADTILNDVPGEQHVPPEDNVHHQETSPSPQRAHDKESERVAKRDPQRTKKLIIGAVIALALIFVMSVGYLIWNTWFRFDDGADIQGSWVSTSGEPVTISADEIAFSSDIAFHYSLNAQDKTIAYDFGEGQGKAWYHFTSNRNMLVIDENHPADAFVMMGLASDPALADPTAEGVTVLVRTSSLTAES